MPESAESMTTYQYAGNNAVMGNDPMGNLNRLPVAPEMSYGNGVGDNLNDLGPGSYLGGGGGSGNYAADGGDYSAFWSALLDFAGSVAGDYTGSDREDFDFTASALSYYVRQQNAMDLGLETQLANGQFSLTSAGVDSYMASASNVNSSATASLDQGTSTDNPFHGVFLAMNKSFTMSGNLYLPDNDVDETTGIEYSTVEGGNYTFSGEVNLYYNAPAKLWYLFTDLYYRGPDLENTFFTTRTFLSDNSGTWNGADFTKQGEPTQFLSEGETYIGYTGYKFPSTAESFDLNIHTGVSITTWYGSQAGVGQSSQIVPILKSP